MVVVLEKRLGVRDRRYHVHQKPLDLIRHLVLVFVLVSTELGQLVFGTRPVGF